ncbi:uncharacterized protein LOC129570584 [Sitodiplosis mosellana]|uniref:uncharacterized protein LOC129570584 n=1 Tax=Sitodiplosis mosellana TaxID=263140 RepID=UPI002443BC4F|nr:uncharacterized protein LOC129570584 [Sitodiplosis mosellana]
MSDVQAPRTGYKNQALSADLRGLYLDATTSDVNFIFKLDDDKEESLPAHKSLLAARSDVFHAMFYGATKKKADIKIVDTTPADFKEFLKFFYFSDVELTMENVPSIIKLGKKYKVAACMDVCVQLLKDKLTVENACFIYGRAIHYKQNDLKQLCEEKIIENTEAVFESSSFLDSPKSVLRQILNLDKLSSSEGDVFKACMTWVKSKSGKETLTKKTVEKHLGDLFYEIRFRSMTIQDFADLTPTYGNVFLNAEFKECVQLIGSKDFQPIIFTTKARQLHGNNYEIIECDLVTEVLTTWNNLQSFSNILSSSETIALVQLVLTWLRIYRGEEWRSDLTDPLAAEILITTSDGNNNTQVLLKQTAHWQCERETVVTLSKHILIRPGNMYTIQVNVDSPNDYCYTLPLVKTNVELEPNIVIQFHSDLLTNDAAGRPISPLVCMGFAPIVDSLPVQQPDQIPNNNCNTSIGILFPNVNSNASIATQLPNVNCNTM